jgi:hypothetical protein
MIVRFKPSVLFQTRWYEYLIRFALGGAMTVVAGLIAARFGPVIGGLFLAFPAIFPASATLIEKHVRERKEKAGLPGARRGKEAAALDAAGAALGSFGLAAFGLVMLRRSVWELGQRFERADLVACQPRVLCSHGFTPLGAAANPLSVRYRGERVSAA